jgi:hypothetical protein
MVTKNVHDKPLTPLQAKVLREYRKYLGKYRVANRNAHVTIRNQLRDWLAQPARREWLNLEVMPTGEQIELIDAIVDTLQGKRTRKAAGTRASNAKLEQEAVQKARQGTLDL